MTDPSLYRLGTHPPLADLLAGSVVQEGSAGGARYQDGPQVCRTAEEALRMSTLKRRE